MQRQECYKVKPVAAPDSVCTPIAVVVKFKYAAALSVVHERDVVFAFCALAVRKDVVAAYLLCKYVAIQACTRKSI